jgi:hypothetical protein
MTPSHVRALPPSLVSQSESTSAFDRLQAFLKERKQAGKPTGDLEKFEEELHVLFSAAEAEAVGEELQRYDVDVPVVLVGEEPHRQVLRAKDTYFTPAGPVAVLRSLYATRTEPGEQAVVPMELRAGIVEGRFTPRAAKQALWFVAQLPPQAVEELYQRLGGLTPSRTLLDRLPKRISEHWEEHREKWEAALRAQERLPDEVVAVGTGIDGVLIPMKNPRQQAAAQAATAEQPNPEAVAQASEHVRQAEDPRKVPYREVGCGTLALYNAEGDIVSTIRCARMPEKNKATLKEMLTAELTALLAQRPTLITAQLGDGAHDNWTFLSTLPGKGPQILDFCHAASHLDDGLKAAYTGKGAATQKAEYERLRHILRHEHGGVDKVIRRLRYLHDKYPRRKVLTRELKYFRRNKHRMRYAELAEAGLPIGTGITEASCKTLAGQRLKCSGMSWGPDGGQAILTLRSLIQSDRFDAAWALLAPIYTKDVTVPANVIPIRRGAR